MALFEPIEITWNGEEKEVPSEKVMGVLARVEESMTFGEANRLIARSMSGDRKQIKVATAYAELLIACGWRKVKVEDILPTLDAEGYLMALVHLTGVLKLTLAPDERERYERIIKEAEEDDDTPPPQQEAPPQGKSKAARSSSKKRTKPQSGAAG